MKWIIAKSEVGSLMVTREAWDNEPRHHTEPDGQALTIVLEFEADTYEEARKVLAQHQGWET